MKTDAGFSGQRKGTVGHVLSSMALVVVLVLPMPHVARAGELFWSQNGGIWRGNTDGTGAELFTAAFDPRGIALSGTELIWSDVEPRVPITPTGVVRARPLDGAESRPVAINQHLPEGIDVDSVSMMAYWSDAEQHSISRTSLDGSSEVETILGGIASIAQIHDVAVDTQAGHVYFGFVNPLIDGLFPGAIGRMNLDGSGQETIVSGLSEPWGVAVDRQAGKVYWSDVLPGGGGLVRRADLDGTNVVDLVSGLLEPRGLELDTVSSQLYWTDLGAKKIQRSDMNGMNVVDLFTNLDQPRALALFHTLVPLPGDFDGDGVLDLDDINALTLEVEAATHGAPFDLNRDASVDPLDIGVWIHDLKNTWFGDADLDGQFNSSDLVNIFQVGKYELDTDAGWSEGDWTGDRRFTSADFVAAFSDGGYERGPRPAIASIPEPNALVLIGLGTLLVLRIRSRAAMLSVSR